MTTEKTSSPRRSGADWFGLVAFAVLVICSAVLVVRLISTKFLPTGQLLLAVGALLVLSGLHGWVQLPHREKTGGKIACGIVAWCWPPPCSMARWLLVPCSTPSPMWRTSPWRRTSPASSSTPMTRPRVWTTSRATGSAFWRTGIPRTPSPSCSSCRRSWERQSTRHTPSPALLTDALYDDQVGAILLNKGYIPLLEEQEGYADFSDRTRILYEYTTTKTVEPAPADTNAQVDVTKGPFVVYCSGIDARSSNINITSRSDVNILAVVNPTTRQILLVNTPGTITCPWLTTASWTS